ncbi:MAG: hypothetical protein JW966_10425 [Anaerolineae bacterium]|nr:hypothetical protein [Anaerolineae bacterium]
MLKRILGDRTYTFTVVVFSIALAVCGIAWTRFFWVAATNPSPVRYVEFVSDQGEIDSFRQSCSGPAFIDDDTVWRYCEYNDHASLSLNTLAQQWGLVRFKLAEGKAELRWALPEDETSQVLALAKAPNGDLAVAWGAPELSAIYRVFADGGVRPLGLPSSASNEVAGLAWVDGSLELVIDHEPVVTISAYTEEAWNEPRTVPLPDKCDEGFLCTLQLTFRDDDGWHFVYVRVPVQIDNITNAEVDVLHGTETQSPELVDSLPLTHLGSQQYILDNDNNLIRLGDLFDRSPGNVVNWSLSAAPFSLDDSALKQVKSPTEDASFYFSDYLIGPRSLKWIPGLRYPRHGWLLDNWLLLEESDKGIKLATFDGKTGPTLTSDTTFLQQSGTQTSLLPAADGEYWILGPHGAYMKVDQSMTRVDKLNVVERIERAFDNFGTLRPYNSNFYREQTLLKMLAFPLVLLSLPSGYLLVFFMRQYKRNTRQWVVLLMQVSAVYLILVTIFLWWFWEIMDNF